MLKMLSNKTGKKIEKKKLKSTELTHQTRDIGYKSEITTKKVNHKKLSAPISKKPSVKGKKKHY